MKTAYLSEQNVVINETGHNEHVAKDEDFYNIVVNITKLHVDSRSISNDISIPN